MSDKLIACSICLDKHNSQPLAYTTCCKQGTERMVINRCPYCKNQNSFQLEDRILDYQRAYNTLN